MPCGACRGVALGVRRASLAPMFSPLFLPLPALPLRIGHRLPTLGVAPLVRGVKDLPTRIVSFLNHSSLPSRLRIQQTTDAVPAETGMRGLSGAPLVARRAVVSVHAWPWTDVSERDAGRASKAKEPVPVSRPPHSRAPSQSSPPLDWRTKLSSRCSLRCPAERTAEGPGVPGVGTCAVGGGHAKAPFSTARACRIFSWP